MTRVLASVSNRSVMPWLTVSAEASRDSAAEAIVAGFARALRELCDRSVESFAMSSFATGPSSFLRELRYSADVVVVVVVQQQSSL